MNGNYGNRDTESWFLLQS